MGKIRDTHEAGGHRFRYHQRWIDMGEADEKNRDSAASRSDFRSKIRFWFEQIRLHLQPFSQGLDPCRGQSEDGMFLLLWRSQMRIGRERIESEKTVRKGQKVQACTSALLVEQNEVG